MKAISIRQPWAHLILCKEKKYEYRAWSTEHRGDLLICSSANPKIEGTLPGHALCVVNITDVIQVTKKNYRELGLDDPPARGEKLYAWKIEDVRGINPFPVKGKLNFYSVDDALIHIVDDTEKTEEEVQAEGTSSIVIFPEFQKLKDDVERLRTELSMLLLERDELQFVISKNLNTAYMLKFGSLEYKAYEAQCTALRLKRKIELIQAKLNRQEKIIQERIEAVLDAEFAEYQAKLEEQINKMNEAIERSKLPALSEEETKEIKQIYRNVVKSLHPDLNPHGSPAQIRLFENAVKAYKSGDIPALRIIQEMIADHKLPEAQKDSLSILREKHAELSGLVKTIQESIDKIKSEYPFTMEDILNDATKAAAWKTELEKIAAQYAGLIESYSARLKEMLG